jgi:hypothetical protein
MDAFLFFLPLSPPLLLLLLTGIMEPTNKNLLLIPTLQNINIVLI